MGIEKVEHHGCRYAVRSDRCGMSLTNLLLARRHARRSLSNPFRCVIPVSMISRQSVKKEGILIIIITKLRHTVKKNKIQNQITSIYMIQVRRKETNLLVQNVLYANNTQDRPPFCRVVEV